MKQTKNFCVSAAAVGMVFGGIGLAVLCFRRPETAAALGIALLSCGAAAFLARTFLLRFAPRHVAGKRLDKSMKNGGMAWLAAYDGNEDLWLGTEEDAEEEGGTAAFVKLERREGLERLFFSAVRQRLLECGLENGVRVWACVLEPGGFKRVWLMGTLELPESGGIACVTVQRGKLSENPKKYDFDAGKR